MYQASLLSPQAIALEDENTSIDYATLDGLASGAMDQLDFLKEKTVTLLAKNSLSTYILIIALYRLKIKTLLWHPKIPHPFPFFVIDPELYRLEKKISKRIEIHLDSIAFYFASSGSSGERKIICHSLETLFNSAKSTIKNYFIQEFSIFASLLPINHVGGFLIFIRSVLSLGKVTIGSNKNFDYVSFVPTQLIKLIKEKSPLLSHLKGCKKILVGGALAHPFLIEQAKDLNLPISYTYGMTEMASQVTAGDLSIGFPLPNKSIRIDKDHEILVKGNSLFLGYGFNPIKSLNLDGYFATKDLGHFDEKKGLTFLGRKDRQFTKGGENICPEMIEAIISKTEAKLFYVLGLEDMSYGHKIGCFIKPNTHFIQEKVNEAILNQLGSFYRIDFFFDMPSDSGLKPSLPSLKELGNRLINSLI